MKKNKLILLTILFISLSSYGQTITEIAKIAISSTVSIISLDQTLQPLAFGSGFIIDDELIATNVHGIEGSNTAYVLLNKVEKKFEVSGYVAIDKSNDLVILKVSGLHGTKLQLGTETPPEIGEKIYVVGNPKGLNGTFSEGIISGIRDLSTSQILQITAPISPGSSGGPVLDSSGHVVGIAFASFTNGQNLNFAIPVKYLLDLKTKIEMINSISTIKAQTKMASTSTLTTNIKEGVSIINLEMNLNQYNNYVQGFTFSLRNNLQYSVSNVKILVLLYDASGNMIDYIEEDLFNWEDTLKPLLSKLINLRYENQLKWKDGYKIKARVLDFKIIE
jgi:S1-C subfamily serine protease